MTPASTWASIRTLGYFQPHGQPRPCRHCHYLVMQDADTGTVICGQGGVQMPV